MEKNYKKNAQDSESHLELHIESIEQKVKNIEDQSSLLLSQVIDLSGQVYRQQEQILRVEERIIQELKKFQTKNAQHAMSSVFNKFFKDILKVMNNMDDLLAVSNESSLTDEMKSWVVSMKTIQSGMESVLMDWGCVPVEVIPGEDQFNPEIHQAVGVITENEGKKKPENTILKVQRRGWKIQNMIIQYPQVITN